MTGHALIEKAMLLAMRAHEGQKRKEGDTPYIVHPVEVALILARHGFPEDVLAAALVHDTVEDTSVTLEDVRRELGDGIAKLVAPVTHDDSLPWEEKKHAYLESVRNAPEDVKAISVADKIANAKSLIAAAGEQGAAVWRHFNRGRDKKLWFEHAVLDMLRESWQNPLVDEYAKLVDTLDTLPY
ncbi:MAG: bifunctional (p)ppGpp synthetase/guanosine-3',5'-bis(diphosphate) 3'-pyrophosphohydrolase [Patescibacteria group bacterium]|nr:HD domain-containing protein [Patescibacteria group bacterium]MDE1966143.1 bifunctional (p)ppGpp synthetase/guanosine-3',5'-bis(diphosphate) 3'-pyrophosphohydrolase [Patescibacteria group bacterium]